MTPNEVHQSIFPGRRWSFSSVLPVLLGYTLWYIPHDLTRKWKERLLEEDVVSHDGSVGSSLILENAPKVITGGLLVYGLSRAPHFFRSPQTIVTSVVCLAVYGVTKSAVHQWLIGDLDQEVPEETHL